MREFPTSITNENFDQALSFVSFNLTKVKKKNMIKKIAKPVGSFLFTFLSFLLVYGALYKYSSKEEQIVFEKFGFLTNIWNGLCDLVTKPDMEWYVSWLVLVAAIFIIPLLVSAVISVIISFVVKEKENSMSGLTTIEKAKQLNNMAKELKSSSSNYDDGSMKTVCKWIFVLAISAFLVYAFVIIKMTFAVKMLAGFAIAAVALYFVYGLIFSCFYSLNKLFYKKTSAWSIVGLTDAFWLSVDPDEKKRREQEAEKKRREQEAEKKKREQAEKRAKTTATASTTTSSRPVDKYDTFTWTASYVRSNEASCSDMALSILKVSKDLLSEGDYSGAAAGFDKVVRALELLQFIDEEYYQPPLFANCYALSRIFAFGLNNRASALEYAEKACEYAEKCAAYNRQNSASARRDLETIRYFRDELKSSRSLASIADGYIEQFPYDILEMN